MKDDYKEVRILTAEWSDEHADIRYYLNTLVEYENGERRRKANDLGGDRDWAERIAKHYSLEMPEVKE